MRIQVKTYYPANSLLHNADARLKIVLLALATVGLFAVGQLPGMLCCFAAGLLLVALSRVPAVAFRPFLPAALVFALFPLVFNGFAFDVYTAQEVLAQYYGVSSEGLSPVAVLGTFGVVPSGLLYGAVLGLRIFLLILLSLVFTFTTSANDVVKAISWYLSPFARFGLPVRDIATTFSLVLRFIPVINSELSVVADAHRARGASLDEGSPIARMTAWGNVFIPLFVRLFRRAETLGTAMDARCYGAHGALPRND